MAVDGSAVISSTMQMYMYRHYQVYPSVEEPACWLHIIIVWHKCMRDSEM